MGEKSENLIRAPVNPSLQCFVWTIKLTSQRTQKFKETFLNEEIKHDPNHIREVWIQPSRSATRSWRTLHVSQVTQSKTVLKTKSQTWQPSPQPIPYFKSEMFKPDGLIPHRVIGTVVVNSWCPVKEINFRDVSIDFHPAWHWNSSCFQPTHRPLTSAQSHAHDFKCLFMYTSGRIGFIPHPIKNIKSLFSSCSAMSPWVTVKLPRTFISSPASLLFSWLLLSSSVHHSTFLSFCFLSMATFLSWSVFYLPCPPLSSLSFPPLSSSLSALPSSSSSPNKTNTSNETFFIVEFWFQSKFASETNDFLYITLHCLHKWLIHAQ